MNISSFNGLCVSDQVRELVKLHQSLIDTGGFTLNEQLITPTKGYVVAILPQTNVQIPYNILTFDIFRIVMRQLLDRVRRKNFSEGEYYVGGWWDQEENRVHFDIVRVFQELTLARSVGKSFKQKAIYCLHEKKEYLVEPKYRECALCGEPTPNKRRKYCDPCKPSNIRAEERAKRRLEEEMRAAQAS